MNLSTCSCKKPVEKGVDDRPAFGYKGGTFANDEIFKARCENSPLTMDCALPGTCLNNCTFCGFLSVNKNDKLKPREIFRVFDEFAALGGKSVKILGEGEPMLRRDILSLLKHIISLGMTPVLFTCGDVLGSDDLCQTVHHRSCDELVQDLYDMGVTVMLKYEKKHEDDIVQRKGYSVLREKALQPLLSLGFNKHYPSRLGFAMVLLKQNYKDIPSIFEYALVNNIYPLVCPLMPIGKMADACRRQEFSPSPSEIALLSDKLISLREQKGIGSYERGDFPGGRPCDIARAGMYLDDVGNIKVCEADRTVGNIRNLSMEKLWEQCSCVKDQKYKKSRWKGLCFPKRHEGVIKCV